MLPGMNPGPCYYYSTNPPDFQFRISLNAHRCSNLLLFFHEIPKDVID